MITANSHGFPISLESYSLQRKHTDLMVGLFFFSFYLSLSLFFFLAQGWWGIGGGGWASKLTTAKPLKYFFFFFLTMLCGLWDLSSPTRDQTWALGGESAES